MASHCQLSTHNIHSDCFQRWKDVLYLRNCHSYHDQDVDVICECKNKSRLWKPLVQRVWKEIKQEKRDKREKTEF